MLPRSHLPVATQGGIHANDIDPSQVHCTPDEHIVRNAHNLVGHPIAIAVQRSLNIPSLVTQGFAVTPISRRSLFPCKPDIQLSGFLRLQIRTSIMEEIVLVESRNPEDILVRSPEIEFIAGSTTPQEPIRKRKRWRKPACILGCLSCLSRIGAAWLSLYLVPHAVEVNRSQHSGKSHPSSLRISGGERLQDTMSMRTQVGGKGAVERIHHPVGRVIYRPAITRNPHQGCRSIIFPLPVGGIIAPISHERVLIGRTRPVHLGLHLQHPTVIETSGLPPCLGKGVAVVQLLGSYIGVISHDAWQLPVVVIIVDLCPQLAPAHAIGSPAHHPVHIQFAMSRVHPTVGSPFVGGVLTVA